MIFILFVIFLISLFFISNIFTVYPAIDALNTLDERVSEPCINCYEWMQGNISSNQVIASDHRLSMLLWAEGYNITFGESNMTWTAENISGCIDEILTLNITYIIIDDIMRERVVNIDVGEYYYMTNGSYDKFSAYPFTLVYRNATYNQQFEEVHWIELYQINQTYLTEMQATLSPTHNYPMK